MDSVQSGYLRISYLTMCVIGLWPHQKTWERALIQIVFFPTLSFQALMQVGGGVAAWMAGDNDAAMETIAPFLISLLCLCKYVNYTYNHGQMKKLMISMVDDWNIYSKSSPYEYDILCKSYATAKKIIIYYATKFQSVTWNVIVDILFAVLLNVLMTPFLSMPVLLNVGNYMDLYNLSGDKPLIFRTEYFLGVERNYYLTLTYSYIATLGYIVLAVALDSTLLFHIQHECGMCEILGYRLSRIVDASASNPHKKEVLEQQNIKNCVLIHTHIIECIRCLENANTMSHFFQIGFCMIGMTFTIFQAVMKLDHINQALRYISFEFTLLCALFLESWPGQQLSNYTDKIFMYITSGIWYECSFSVRKMIRIMQLRSYVPIRVTAGKLYVLGLENFATILRTSFSYFTVLYSMQ